MRGGRAYWILLIYNGVLCAAMSLMYAAWITSSQPSDWVDVAPRFGSRFFSVMTGLQAGLAVLLSPAFTCGAVTIEREQRTFEMLVLTLVHPNTIIIGKLVSALSYILLLAVSSIPLVAICFLFGGVSPEELIASYLVILGCAFFFGLIGLACSTMVKRTTVSTAIAYGITMFFAIGTVLLDFILSELVNLREPLFLYLNPIAAIISVREPRFMGPASVAPAVWPFTLCFYAMIAGLIPLAIVRRLKP